ncbi:MAG: hypothetical protein EAZ89_14410 [Bacteroidetes bacterium]|jgi:tRNA_anti-like|nr:MAG: hypothetical protein EAZ89_14410 [Bacteroidota bacterium]
MKPFAIRIIIALLLGTAVAATVGYYLYNKPHEDLTAKPADAVLTVAALTDAYMSDEAAADKLYLGKTVEVSGVVGLAETTADGAVVVTLSAEGSMASVGCSFLAENAAAAAALTAGQQVRVVGLVDGFLLPDVKLSRCVLLK